MRIRTITMLVVFAVAGTALAWGPDGHRAVCQIAYLHLDKAHQKEVDRLAKKMAVPPGVTKYTSFAQGCTFPDEVRGNSGPAFAKYQTFNEWHFLNVPRTTKTIDAGAPCNNNCVLHGIEFHTAALKNATDDQSRAEALLFLGHWVGDIHQPLHISYFDDKGGNDIKPINGGLYTSKTLHSVWDSGIIVNDESNQGWKVFANGLNNKITAADATSWLGGTRFDWANESYQIAMNPDVQYCKENAAKTSCDPIPGPSRTLKQPYQDEFHPDVETRLEKAGIRLADIIQNNLPVH
ncbi:MAG TPA: S1/P1 nuclease [Vicinamibacterales bacterium]